jgi:orotidine-5'-phosphate decarboxylase
MDPLIVALDVESAAAARALVDRLGPACRFYKVGLELYAAAGPEFVRQLRDEGHDVFLDLKLHDIGETVKRATAQVAQWGVRFLTVHAEPQVLRAAQAGKGHSPLQILGVTVLTSLDNADLAAMGFRHTVPELVDLRVRHIVEAGVDGVVCSPLEVSRVRQLGGPQRILVTPGVRSPGADPGDQKRVTTPAEALRSGANYLVIGRQVTRASDPRRTLEAIREELS